MCRVKFSEHCGRNIHLARDGCSAVRVNGFSEGILLSERKLPNDKVFEVQMRSCLLSGTVIVVVASL